MTYWSVNRTQVCFPKAIVESHEKHEANRNLCFVTTAPDDKSNKPELIVSNYQIYTSPGVPDSSTIANTLACNCPWSANGDKLRRKTKVWGNTAKDNEAEISLFQKLECDNLGGPQMRLFRKAWVNKIVLLDADY